jgi:hypothetical protein
MKTQLLLVCLVFLIHFRANAQCETDQSQLLTNAGRSARNLPGYYEGQTFTAGATGLLCEIDMLMFNTMSGTGTLKIYSGSGIRGTLLNTQIVNVNVPSMTSVWQNWTISSPLFVTDASVYTFQFIPIQGGGLPDPYGVNLQTSNVYSGGNDLASTNWDLMFMTYVDVTTNINDIPGEINLKFYPNPVADVLTIETPQRSLIEILNTEGQIIKIINDAATTTSIDVRNLTGGVYMVRVKTDKEIVTRKFIKE